MRNLKAATGKLSRIFLAIVLAVGMSCPVAAFANEPNLQAGNTSSLLQSSGGKEDSSGDEQSGELDSKVIEEHGPSIAQKNPDVRAAGLGTLSLQSGGASYEPAQPSLQTQALATSGVSSVGKPTLAELKAAWNALPDEPLGKNIFSTINDNNAYSAATLTSGSLSFAQAYLNLIRKSAGLDSVSLNSTLNANAAQGALILAKLNGGLTHEPKTPSGVSDSAAAPGKYACGSSNISMASASFESVSVLSRAIQGQMNDSSSYENLKCVGHRRWLLNPATSTMGIGSAYVKDGSWHRYYTDIRVLNQYQSSSYGIVESNGRTSSYDFIAWPASGAFLNNLFPVGTPWSVTLNSSKYKTGASDLSGVSVKLTRYSDNASWTMRNDGSTPSAKGKYLVVDTTYIGIPNCIIFNPGSDNLGANAYEGTYRVDISGLKTKAGASTSLSYEVNFSDASIPLSDVSVSVSPSSFTYDGYSKTPTLTLTYGRKTLTKDIDYYQGYPLNNVNAGTASITLKGAGRYTGSRTVTYAIARAPITSLSFSNPQPPYVYDGSAKKPGVVVYAGSRQLSSSQYDISYANNVNRGMASVTVTGKGNYTGTLTKQFEIYSTVAKPTAQSFTYNGKEQVGVPYSSAYEVTSGTQAATNAGSYSATVKPKAGYRWTTGGNAPITLSWAIYRKPVDVPVAQNFTYDGKLHSGVPSSDAYSMTGTTSAAAAGMYSTKLTPNRNYQWRNGSTNSVTINWNVYPKKVAKPVARNFTYDGKYHEGVSKGDGYVLGIGTVGETNVGTYTISVSPDSSCVWSDGTANTLALTWRIDPIKVSKPVGKNFVYDGYLHEGVSAGAGYTLSGTTAASSIGTYYAFAKPIANYAWSDGSTAEQTVKWSINRKSVTIPKASNFTYDGRSHTGVPAGEGYTLSGTTSAWVPGVYTATATLNSNCQWSDGTTAPKQLTWRIDPISVATPKASNFTFDGRSHVGVPSGAGYTLSGTTSATNAGTYLATATPKFGYRWSDGSSAAKAITWCIDPVSVAKPKASNFTYDGRSHTGVPAGAGYTLSGTTAATNVGTYLATATLKAGYRWSDGSTGAVTLTWKINARPAASTPSTPSTSRPSSTTTTRSSSSSSKSVAKVFMHRLYNPNSGEHFYTASTSERNKLVPLGWKYEGLGWYAPATSKSPVYRLYNPNSGDHHYTLAKSERDWLSRIGWNYEGIGWYSDDARGVPLYRQFNPNAVIGTHNYTTSKQENDALVRIGWHGEGIAWYGVK